MSQGLCSTSGCIARAASAIISKEENVWCVRCVFTLKWGWNTRGEVDRLRGGCRRTLFMSGHTRVLWDARTHKSGIWVYEGVNERLWNTMLWKDNQIIIKFICFLFPLSDLQFRVTGLRLRGRRCWASEEGKHGLTHLGHAGDELGFGRIRILRKQKCLSLVIIHT